MLWWTTIRLRFDAWHTTSNVRSRRFSKRSIRLRHGWLTSSGRAHLCRHPTDMHVFFDLDGTLTDSSAGMRNSFHHALLNLGRPVPSDDRIHRCFGPPLAAAFQWLLETTDDDVIEAAIAAYRGRYATIGLFESEPYPGVLDGLQTLRHTGHRLRLVTAKPEPYARRIIQHLGMLEFFEAVHAPTLADRTRTKDDCLKAAVYAVAAERTPIVMVGDLVDDVRAAHNCGVMSIGVAWGFGVEDDLVQAAPTIVARSMADVVEWVQRTDPIGPARLTDNF